MPLIIELYKIPRKNESDRRIERYGENGNMRDT